MKIRYTGDHEHAATVIDVAVKNYKSNEITEGFVWLKDGKVSYKVQKEKGKLKIRSKIIR